MLHVIPDAQLASADPSLVADKVANAPADQPAGLSASGKATNPTDGLDLSKPMSILIREGTVSVHDEINSSPAAQVMSNGDLAKREYVRFLFMLWHVYDELERALFEHREHPVIFHIYHPRIFSRATALSFDICHLLDTVTWQTDPFYVEFYNNIPVPVQTYINRIAHLGRPDAPEADVSLLAAHAYVRYLGDLSGGQIIRRKIIKAYDLYDDGDGIAFYNFRTLDPRTGDRPAEMHEIRKIKDWFKAGLDDAVTDKDTKVGIVLESIAAFRYNSEVFKCLDGSKTRASEPVEAPTTLLASGTTSFATLAAVILAASLAHFLLTVNGYTGSAGADKLHAVIGWLRTGAGSKV